MNTAEYFNQLARELRADPNALEKRFARQIAEAFAPAVPKPQPLPVESKESESWAL